MIIPPEIFSIGTCAARESTRYAINDVLVERMDDGSCRAVATDGRRLMVASWTDGDDWKAFPAIDGMDLQPEKGFRVLVPMYLWSEAAKLKTKIVLDEHVVNGQIKMASVYAKRTTTITVPVVDGNFPKYEDIIPNYTIGENAVEIGMTPNMLAECASTLGELATDEVFRGIRLVVPKDKNRPLLITAQKSGRTGIVVLMPYNLDGTQDSPSIVKGICDEKCTVPEPTKKRETSRRTKGGKKKATKKRAK